MLLWYNKYLQRAFHGTFLLSNANGIGKQYMTSSPHWRLSDLLSVCCKPSRPVAMQLKVSRPLVPFHPQAVCLSVCLSNPAGDIQQRNSIEHRPGLTFECRFAVFVACSAIDQRIWRTDDSSLHHPQSVRRVKRNFVAQQLPSSQQQLYNQMWLCWYAAVRNNTITYYERSIESCGRVGGSVAFVADARHEMLMWCPSGHSYSKTKASLSKRHVANVLVPDSDMRREQQPNQQRNDLHLHTYSLVLPRSFARNDSLPKRQQWQRTDHIRKIIYIRLSD